MELDPVVIELANTRLSGLNQGALQDPRVHVVLDDAFRWLRDAPDSGFDAVIVDLPDPDTPALGRLYSTEFYGLAAAALNPGGLMVVQSGSPYSTPDAYWRTTSTIASAGLAVTPYHVLVPSFGDWGYVLARRGPEPPALRLPHDVPELRFLDEPTLAASAIFPRDRPCRELGALHLDRPRIVDDMRKGYER